MILVRSVAFMQAMWPFGLPRCQGPTALCAGGIGNNGEARWEYFRHVVAVPSIKQTGGALR